LGHGRLRVQAGEQQPAVLRREYAEQLRDAPAARAAVGLFASLHNEQNSPGAAGFRGAFARSPALQEVRAAQSIGEAVPGRLELAAKGVQVEIQDAIRKRAAGQID